MVAFRDNAKELLGAKLKHAEFDEVGIPDTLDYVPYTDKDQNKVTFPNLDEGITS